ncbi:LysR family transcriptional regulator [Pseudomonas lalucatii]|uniref:LysR family transcriptional regulator n=1 Tax=Pseudomonas lalucatii TaxID=1424203 RepID=A0ABS5PWF6_9PSED|nr:LysR family transcriptional regulator [Pseudomonas lalucatii]MBS7660833.1 LysR family transcriptional regulator [Pseudomonas lalucatii]MBS7724422.1 LysR family transcriptional regulator [Pseudomonas lalucatii]QVM87590.1 LysR family transcriptional regulator [Pseudomonas lalucatii]
MLDHLLLRSFVAVADCGNFTRAAERLHLTQSTVSQQVRRLEDTLGCRLFDRSVRRVLATAEGERLLSYARRILALHDEAEEVLRNEQSEGVLRLGVPEDFAEAHPKVRLEVSSGLSPELLRRYHDGEFDLLLSKQMKAGNDCLAAWPEPLCWMDSRQRPALVRDPLPLVAFAPGGLYRQEMIQALEVNGRNWRISYSSASLASVCAAVAAGLGISLLPRRVLQSGHRLLTGESGLPPIDGIHLVLYGRPGLGQAGQVLQARLHQLCQSQAAADY